MSNEFESFSRLPTELQKEAIREGELRLQAQLQVATAADQRALTWGGLLVAAVTGALGGGLALVAKEQPDYVLGALAIGFALSMLKAAWKALDTVRPGLFCMPGNKPGNWLPENWACTGSTDRKCALARIDQAEQMTRHIGENAKTAGTKAAAMSASFRHAKRTITWAVEAIAVVLLIRLTQPYLTDALAWGASHLAT